MKSYNPEELNAAQRKIRDHEAERYLDWYVDHVGEHFDITERDTVINWLCPQENDIILDAGCGVGRLVLPLSKRCRKVYAVDFSPQSIEILNKSINSERLVNVVTLVGDITQPINLPEQVDKIICVATLQHIPTASMRMAVINNFYNLLKENGHLVMTVWNYFPRKLKFKFLGRTAEQEYFTSSDGENSLYCYKFLPAEVRSLLENSSFIDIKIGGSNSIPRPISKLTGKYLVRLDTVFSKFGFSSYTGSYLIVSGTKSTHR